MTNACGEAVNNCSQICVDLIAHRLLPPGDMHFESKKRYGLSISTCTCVAFDNTPKHYT